MSGGQPIKTAISQSFLATDSLIYQQCSRQHFEQKQDIVFDAARRKKRKLLGCEMCVKASIQPDHDLRPADDLRGDRHR